MFARHLSAALLASVLLAGCLSTHPRMGPPAPEPVFRPEVFFLGRTQGVGTLKVRTKSTKEVRVESLGTPQADGTFRLDQTITMDGERTETRIWVMRPTAPRTTPRR